MFISREGPVFCFVAKIRHLVTSKNGACQKKPKDFFRKKSHKVSPYFEEKKVLKLPYL
jgi:hypothetical protein